MSGTSLRSFVISQTSILLLLFRRTHPDAFGLQLYLNVNFPADAPQSGPPNALGTSSLVYTGEDLEHDIVLSPKVLLESMFSRV